jgi:hypothetical protein
MKNKLNYIIAIFAIIVFTTTFGCKKAIEDAKEQAVVNAITDGVWYVSNFAEGGTNTTADFAGWEFRYFDNGTCVANKTGQPTVNGTWSGNAATWTFTTTFTSVPPAPLPKLAGTWTVTRAVSTNKGSYTKTEAGVVYDLELTKK